MKTDHRKSNRSIDVNYLIDIDWHWSIDDQSIVTKGYSQLYRLLSIFIDFLRYLSICMDKMLSIFIDLYPKWSPRVGVFELNSNLNLFPFFGGTHVFDLYIATVDKKLNLIHCYWIPFTFEFVTTLKYVLMKLRRYLFDWMYINRGFFSSMKIDKKSMINRWKSQQNKPSIIHRFPISIDW
jgi:hypothetical protein